MIMIEMTLVIVPMLHINFESYYSGTDVFSSVYQAKLCRIIEILDEQERQEGRRMSSMTPSGQPMSPVTITASGDPFSPGGGVEGKEGEGGAGGDASNIIKFNLSSNGSVDPRQIHEMMDQIMVRMSFVTLRCISRNLCTYLHSAMFRVCIFCLLSDVFILPHSAGG